MFLPTEPPYQSYCNCYNIIIRVFNQTCIVSRISHHRDLDTTNSAYRQRLRAYQELVEIINWWVEPAASNNKRVSCYPLTKVLYFPLVLMKTSPETLQCRSMVLCHFLGSESTKESPLLSPLPPDGAGPVCWSHVHFLKGFTRKHKKQRWLTESG